MQYKIVVLLCVVGSAVSAQELKVSKTVNTAQGPVRGYKRKSDDVFSFHGIPYATAPTGEHKYKAPLPPPVWTEVFEATKTNIICPQFKMEGLAVLTENKEMPEDCLIANVYVPDTEEINLPVLVSVHGGGYFLGYGDMMTPRTLVQSKKVIGVTFNYRLGIHGFLCLGTEFAPGNAGLKDQVALLRWVKKNIASFGGNPNDVTVLGGSAGSSSVDLLMLSPAAQGLFDKAIPQSGANVAIWSVQQDPIGQAKDYAKRLNFTEVDDVKALEKFYEPSSIIYNFNPYIFFDNKDSSIGFSPCLEVETGVERVLYDAPVDILKSGRYKKLPMFYGFADLEGTVRIQFFETWKDKMMEKFSDFLPGDLQFETEKEKEEVTKSLQEFYFQNKPVSENRRGYLDYFSDVVFTYPMLRAVKMHVENGHDSIYLYEFKNKARNAGGFYTDPKLLGDIEGADHCAQTYTMLDNEPFNVTEDQMPDNFRKIRTIMTDMTLNFIITGKPIPDDNELSWPAVREDWAPHMSIGETLELKGSLLKERASLWDTIYEKHYRTPQPPFPYSVSHTEL